MEIDQGFSSSRYVRVVRLNGEPHPLSRGARRQEGGVSRDLRLRRHLPLRGRQHGLAPASPRVRADARLFTSTGWRLPFYEYGLAPASSRVRAGACLSVGRGLPPAFCCARHSRVSMVCNAPIRSTDTEDPSPLFNDCFRENPISLPRLGAPCPQTGKALSVSGDAVRDARGCRPDAGISKDFVFSTRYRRIPSGFPPRGSVRLFRCGGSPERCGR